MLWIMSSPWFPEPMAQPWLDPVHPAGPGIFSGTQFQHGLATGLTRRSFSCFPYCSRMSSGLDRRDIFGAYAAALQPRSLSISIIKPTLNPGERKVEGPAGPGHGDLAPSMISITSAVLRFAVQRLMLSSMVTLIATFFPVA